jgi:hypothetical protein
MVLENGMESQPQNFDWVTARAECSVNVVFRMICLGIESDVVKRNALIGTGSPFFTKYEGDDLVVFRKVQRSPFLVFRQTENGIEVLDGHSKAVRLSSSITLCDDGQCRLMVGGAEREFWQFRRRALEGLFFSTPRC